MISLCLSGKVSTTLLVTLSCMAKENWERSSLSWQKDTTWRSLIISCSAESHNFYCIACINTLDKYTPYNILQSITAQPAGQSPGQLGQALSDRYGWCSWGCQSWNRVASPLGGVAPGHWGTLGCNFIKHPQFHQYLETTYEMWIQKILELWISSKRSRLKKVSKLGFWPNGGGAIITRWTQPWFTISIKYYMVRFTFNKERDFWPLSWFQAYLGSLIKHLPYYLRPSTFLFCCMIDLLWYNHILWMHWQPGGEGRILGDPPCGRRPAMLGLRTMYCVMCYLPHVNKLGLIGIEGKIQGNLHSVSIPAEAVVPCDLYKDRGPKFA